ncbi:modulator protein [Enterobacterales bacterium CwR94]|nr:modulator protein [Enterobacterales bacterium CwR94]
MVKEKRVSLSRMIPWAMLAVLAIAAATLLPALFRTETALQIRASRQGMTLPDGFYVYQRLSAEGIRIKSITPASDALVVTLESQEQDAEAIQALYRVLPPGFTIAKMEGKSVAKLAGKPEGKLRLG